MTTRTTPRRCDDLQTATLPKAAADEMMALAMSVYISALVRYRSHEMALLSVFLTGAVQGNLALHATGEREQK